MDWKGAVLSFLFRAGFVTAAFPVNLKDGPALTICGVATLR